MMEYIPKGVISVDRDQVIAARHVESVGRPNKVDSERYRINIKTISSASYTISCPSEETAYLAYDDTVSKVANAR
ncbi:MAG: hypothetical protein ABJG42_24380 [Vibrio splendidus]